MQIDVTNEALARTPTTSSLHALTQFSRWANRVHLMAEKIGAKLQRISRHVTFEVWPRERVQRSIPLKHSAEDRQLAEMRESRLAANSQLLIRSGALGFVVGCTLLQNIDEVTACCRHAHLFTSNDFFCFDGVTIDLFAGFVVGTERGAFQ